MDPLVLNHFSVLEASLTELKQDIQSFIDGPATSAYIQSLAIDAKIGLRKSHHYINFGVYTTLDITSLSVSVSYKPIGVGTKIIKIIRNINPYAGLYLYNVMDERTAEYLVKQGWCKHLLANYFYLTKNAQEGHL